MGVLVGINVGVDDGLIGVFVINGVLVYIVCEDVCVLISTFVVSVGFCPIGEHPVINHTIKTVYINSLVFMIFSSIF